MISNHDHSHATNVINFEALLTYCQSLGGRYNPSQDRLKLTYMQSRLTSTQAVMTALDIALRNDTEARNRRRNLFDGLVSFAVRVVNMYSLCKVNADTLKHARSILKRMRGKRISAARKKTAESAGTENTTQPKVKETSQRSYMYMVQHFQRLVEIINLAANYDPNELDLKLPALEAMLQKLKDANSETAVTGHALDKARTDRNRALYREGDGLVKIAKDVKKYIAIAYGTESPQSVHANSIFFIDRPFKELEEVVADPS